MQNLLIVGAGGHGKVVADCAKAMGIWQHIAFVDQRYPALTSAGPFPVIATADDAVLGLREDFPSIIVAIGDNRLRQRLSLAYEAQGFALATLIHPRATVSEFAKVGKGTVIFAHAVVNIDANIGNCCIINTAAVVEHECEIANAVHLSPNVSLGGQVHVGEQSWLGIGCSVIHGLTIGPFCMVGAGAVVIRNVAEGHTVVGNPARRLRAVDISPA